MQSPTKINQAIEVVQSHLDFPRADFKTVINRINQRFCNNQLTESSITSENIIAKLEQLKSTIPPSNPINTNTLEEAFSSKEFYEEACEFYILMTALCISSSSLTIIPQFSEFETAIVDELVGKCLLHLNQLLKKLPKQVVDSNRQSFPEYLLVFDEPDVLLNNFFYDEKFLTSTSLFRTFRASLVNIGHDIKIFSIFLGANSKILEYTPLAVSDPSLLAVSQNNLTLCTKYHIFSISLKTKLYLSLMLNDADEIATEILIIETLKKLCQKNGSWNTYEIIVKKFLKALSINSKPLEDSILNGILHIIQFDRLYCSLKPLVLLEFKLKIVKIKLQKRKTNFLHNFKSYCSFHQFSTLPLGPWLNLRNSYSPAFLIDFINENINEGNLPKHILVSKPRKYSTIVINGFRSFNIDNDLLDTINVYLNNKEISRPPTIAKDILTMFRQAEEARDLPGKCKFD
ncbi:uncharacterized protein ASCRUDRAFT_7524 [Ascoidea rubescens DSM 1968]|uniref:Uncharacterized protein n=1 Tax=Ascoidea rubescens DSM 1968 TaxID=1344418 RepID=A0A1D2VKG9_9ASCO|nr:hypothetical protein ASCRUDRAFT_7524 [Ascoidea rubescens DSM 1968]ODV62099.1 hypothetical protein ASCRUDRAFT_7524 [Ascoidea rubescens DSM 1968]